MEILIEYKYILQAKEIRENWMNLDEDSKLEYKKEAWENSEKYANLSHNIPSKSRKVSIYLWNF